MKKGILLFFLFVSCTLQAQVKSDSTQLTSGKSLVVVNVDSVNTNEIENIKYNLDRFYSQNRNSHFLYGIAVLFGTLAYLPNAKEAGNFEAFSIIAASSGLLGTVIYLDSYKWLNKDRKRKLKNKN